MKKITTEWIAEQLNTHASQSAVVSGLAIDTRKITPGCLFVCIRGARFDGNEFADLALSLGANAVLCSMDAVCRGPCIRVPDTREAFLKLASAYRGLFDIPVVGLTGSVGKTTTKEMTALVLEGKYKTLKTPGNFNNEIGLPQTLFLLEEDTQAAVIEMGMSHRGEISALTRAAGPTIGLITNIGVSHIENLGSRRGIFEAKMELLDGLKPGSPLLLNGDDEYLSTVRSLPEHKVFTYGIENGDFKGYNIREENFQTRFTVSYFGKKQEILLPALGVHHVYDALSAFAVGHLLGVDRAAAAMQLAGYVPDGMRQKCVDVNGVLSIEDCYNAAPDSMKAAFSTLCALKAKRRIAVLADMLELGSYAPQAHYDVGRMAGNAGIDLLFTYGEFAAEYEKGAKAEGFTACHCFAEKEALCKALCDSVRPGDAVLFKGSRGMKLEEVIRGFYEKWGR